MLSYDILTTPQPRNVRGVAIGLSLVMLLCIFIFHIYPVTLYIACFFFLILSLEDFLLKWTEVQYFRVHPDATKRFKNKFLKHALMSFFLAAACLWWGLLLQFALKDYLFLSLLFGAPPVCFIPDMILLEARVLITTRRDLMVARQK